MYIEWREQMRYTCMSLARGLKRNGIRRWEPISEIYHLLRGTELD